MNKIRIVALDLTGTALEWLNINGNEDHMELCEILTLDDNSPVAIWDLPNYDNWDYLMVFERGVRERTEALLSKIGIPAYKVIYPLDTDGSLLDNCHIASFMLGDYMQRLLRYLSYRRTGEKYSIIETDNCQYVNVSSDNVILPGMICERKNWAKDEMELFYRLSNEYFEFDDEQDIFCDIGANIGTTCIFFKKNIDKNVRILAFEPSIENYKLLKANAILNDIDITKNMFVRKGLSDTDSTAILEYNPHNPGGSSLTKSGSGETDEIELITLDSYLEDNSIDPHRIKYLWIDVEGFEARFLAGAENTISQINVPVFMEFIPRFYSHKDGEFEMLMRELEKHFKYFICAQDKGLGVQYIEKLWDEKDNPDLEWDLFLMKEPGRNK